MLPDIDDLDTYGGPITDYSAVIDPSTDEGAIFRNRYAVNVAAMTRTAARGFCTFVGANGADPTDPLTGFVHNAVYGTILAYKPVLDRIAEGVYTVTLPAEVQQQDIFNEAAAIGGGVTHSLNLRRAHAQVECSDGTLRHAVAERTDVNVIKVRCYLANGTADDLDGQNITVWFY